MSEATFHTEHYTCAEQVFALNHHIGLYLPKESPSASKDVVVLVAEMRSAKELVGVASCRCSDTEIAMMVSTTGDAGLVGNAEAVTAVVVPKTLGTDVTA